MSKFVVLKTIELQPFILTTRLPAILMLSVALIVILLAGCSSGPRPLYYWGHYESILYDIYMKPGEADTETQILKLREDIQRSEAKGLAVAPGIYAHLGVLHANKGELDAAQQAFALEQERFPESRHFVQGMMTRAGMIKP